MFFREEISKMRQHELERELQNQCTFRPKIKRKRSKSKGKTGKIGKKTEREFFIFTNKINWFIASKTVGNLGRGINTM